MDGDYRIGSHAELQGSSCRVITSWQRTVKRKYGEVDHAILCAEDSTRDIVLDKLSSVVPGSGAYTDTSFPSPFNECLTLEDAYRSHNTMANAFIPNSACFFIKDDVLRGEKRDNIAHSRMDIGKIKRTCQPSPGVNPLFDSCSQSDTLLLAKTTQKEVSCLKEALHSEQRALQRLHEELEEERCASAIAANETMSMIARLQEEKAAVSMEARQYKRVAEERDAHSQEAIILLKDILASKEDEIEAYRNMILRIQSEEFREGDGQELFLDEGKEGEHILYIEGQEAGCERCWQADVSHRNTLASSSCLQSQHPRMDIRHRDCGTYSARNNVGAGQLVCLDSYSEEHVDDDKGQVAQIKYTDCASMQGESYASGFEEQNLDALSMSILARVKRLEESFEHSGINQDPEYQRPNAVDYNAWSNKVVSTVDLLEEVPCPSEEYSDYMKRHRFSTSKRLFKDCKNDCTSDCLWTEREGLKSANFGVEMDNTSSTSIDFYSENGSDAYEAIHDVYEVHHETTQSNCWQTQMLARVDFDEDGDKVLQDSQKVSGGGFLEKKEVSGGGVDGLASKHSQLFSEPTSWEPDMEKTLSAELCSLNVQDAPKSVVVEDVCQLKGRLQALEGERIFMNQAIESLRKENKELKLLREIAQQLRELKGDVNRSDNLVRQQQDQFSILSYLKGLFSFAGCPSSVNNKETSFLSPSKNVQETILGEQKYGGLFELLDKSPQAQKDSCVTRGLKLRLPAIKESA